jgi:anthranilate 1,2-dioxygenase small subunit
MKAVPAANDAIERAVVRLNHAYARCLDEDQLEGWPAFFTSDCVYAIHPRENFDAGLDGYWLYLDSQAMLRDRVTSLRKANVYNIHRDRHMLSTIEVYGTDNDVFLARASYLIIQTDVEGRSRVFNTGEYRDRVVDTPTGLRFSERLVIPDTFNVEGLIAIPL